MARRQKTRFEKFFSINQHRKRWGASKVNPIFVDYAKLKNTIIDDGEPVQTYGSAKSVAEHLDSLRNEFSGQSELLYYHAQLIVLLRRDYKPADNYLAFCNLWRDESSFLRESLNLRWLVSACDTVADFDQEGLQRAIALQGSILANTIKIYETERRLTSVNEAKIDPEETAKLHDDLLPLFEGMSCFAVGTDDTLRNMRWRLNSMFEEPMVGPIFEEIYSRMQNCDTAYHRMRNMHKRSRTAWW